MGIGIPATSAKDKDTDKVRSFTNGHRVVLERLAIMVNGIRTESMEEGESTSVQKDQIQMNQLLLEFMTASSKTVGEMDLVY